jgi:hypothetical protein
LSKFTTDQPAKATLFVLTIGSLPVIFSNIEGLLGKDEETEIGASCSAMEVCFSSEVGRSMFDVRRSFSRP